MNKALISYYLRKTPIANTLLYSVLAIECALFILLGFKLNGDSVAYSVLIQFIAGGRLTMVGYLCFVGAIVILFQLADSVVVIATNGSTDLFLNSYETLLSAKGKKDSGVVISELPNINENELGDDEFMMIKRQQPQEHIVKLAPIIITEVTHKEIIAVAPKESELTIEAPANEIPIITYSDFCKKINYNTPSKELYEQHFSTEEVIAGVVTEFEEDQEEETVFVEQEEEVKEIAPKIEEYIPPIEEIITKEGVVEEPIQEIENEVLELEADEINVDEEIAFLKQLSLNEEEPSAKDILNSIVEDEEDRYQYDDIENEEDSGSEAMSELSLPVLPTFEEPSVPKSRRKDKARFMEMANEIKADLENAKKK